MGLERPTASEQGILRPQDFARHVDLRRYPIDGALGEFVERCWAVHWDLPDGTCYRVGLISQPCANVTFGPLPGAQVHGVGTTTSIHPLAGRGRVFGIKFRPGGFFAFTQIDAATLTDRSVPIAEIFGPDADHLAAAVQQADDEHGVRLVERFLGPAVPTESDETYRLVLRIVAEMLDDRTITRVDDAARRFALSTRTLQRIFRTYIGVGPKWLIRRYRMHDAAERLATDPSVDPGALAVELGWFDQAHFTRDFGALIGSSPAEYAAACAATTGYPELVTVG